MTNKYNKDREANKIIQKGEKDSVLEMKKKGKEMSILYEKLDKLNAQLEFKQRTKSEQADAYAETKQKLEQLETKANAKGIYLDEIEQIEDPASKIEKDPQTYARKEKILGKHEIEQIEDPASKIEKDPQTYARKEKILKQAMEADKDIYARKLFKHKTKLAELLEERNDIINRIKERQNKTIEIREKANELMIKSKFITEKDAERTLQESIKSIQDLPEELDIKKNKMMNKLDAIIKSTRKKNRVARSTTKKINSPEPQIPSTKNAFALRQKGQLSNVNHETKNRNNAEKSNSKPFGSNASKPFGNKPSNKPNFMGGKKTELSNMRNAL
eukprot:CAMPEP_0197016884 /NCGR_PEP_ID=MMETSP1380-20130617/79225_1 /TAXON_ID=5936 /ORGANISM="Euplotes crassus, Strain CT5" /LENGTH=329 /DNA_ID=CAMNT_0042443903 /DNA_START=823 /DNA_END=1813 /DNA_ORIENTATION=-